jgi:hypothetical protein
MMTTTIDLSEIDRLFHGTDFEAWFQAEMAYLTTLSEDERKEHETFEFTGLVIRLRALGLSWRATAKFFGGSKSWWGRLAPVIDDLVSRVGQDGWQNPKRVKEALSQVGQETHERQRLMRQFRPADDDALSAGLASLARLLNYDPCELVAAMTPEGRAEAERIAPRVAAWLAAIGSCHA